MMRGGRSRFVALAVAAAFAAGACSGGGSGHPQLVIGVATTAATAAEGSTVVSPTGLAAAADAADPGPLVDFTQRARGESPPAPGLKPADGHPYGTPITFHSSAPVPSDLFFILVVGSDARPNEDVRHSNGDAIHIIAVNPRSGQATIVGIPRDAWVEVPGKGNQKLSTVLQGGPDQEAATIRHLTGLPTKYYVISSFAGLPRLVDDLGGVNIYVDRRMNDPYSGARFEPGWHHFNGADSLAFSRNRHDTPYGDFSRSENQGKLIMGALNKMRAEVGDEGALGHWVDVLMRNAYLSLSLSDVKKLGTVAARLDPKQVRNLVVPGRVGTVGSQSVVFLGKEAADIFNDLRDDAVIGGAGPATTTTTEPPSTTTTTAVAPQATTSSVPSVFRTSTTSTTAPSSSTSSTEPGDSPHP